MATVPLQVSFHTDLLKGGYGRTNGKPNYSGYTDCWSGTGDLVEIVDGSCGYFYDNPTWQDTSYRDEATRTYTWRDSNLDPGLNSRSSEGYVTVKDTWVAEPDLENNLHITHNMYVIAWGRRDVRNATATPARGLACYKAEGENNIQMKQHLGTHAVTETYDQTGNIHIGTFTYVLPPQTSSRGKYPFTGTIIRNWTDGYGSSDPYNKGAEKYADMMIMGADFKNNLPNQFLPPVLQGIEQTADICEDYVTVDINFEPSQLSGADLEFQYWYDGQTVDDAETLWITGVTAGMRLHITLKPVYPSRNHDVHLYWRARFKATNSNLKDSEWTSGSEEIIFIPPPNMSVPDVTTGECSAIARGELIPPYEEIVSYGGNE